LALILVPTLIGDFLALVLNGHGRFLVAALAPLINALISVLALWLWPRLDLSALIWTLVLGSAAQGFVVLAGIVRMGLDFPLRIGNARSEVLTTLALAAPLLPSMILAICR
jgi:peptidoglycan biosynthesis protein MviN/MurJ (putative lipid II flippase)